MAFREWAIFSLSLFTMSWFCFSQCAHNLWYAVTVRIQEQLLRAYQLVDKWKYDFGPMRRDARKIGKRLRVRKWTPQQVINAYSGTQRAVYERAFAKHKVPERWMAKLGYFVKIEGYEQDPRLKTPRPIAPRHPGLRAHMAVYMKPIEHAMVKERGLDRIPFLGKGLNQAGLAKRFLDKWALFRRPICVSLDASKFDGHVVSQMLKVENECWLAAFSYDRMLKEMLKWHFWNEGRGWRHEGARASGDQQTGIGNSLLSHLMIKHAFPGVTTETLCNGDDALLIMEREDWEAQRGVCATFERYGMEMKIEQVTDDPYEVDWCQCRIADSTPPMWVRTPRKIMATVFRGTRYGGRDVYERMLAVVNGELALAAAVPALSTLLGALKAKLSGFKESKEEKMLLMRYKLLTAARVDEPATPLWMSRHLDPVDMAEFAVAVDSFQARPRTMYSTPMFQAENGAKSGS